MYGFFEFKCLKVPISVSLEYTTNKSYSPLPYISSVPQLLGVKSVYYTSTPNQCNSNDRVVQDIQFKPVSHNIHQETTNETIKIAKKIHLKSTCYIMVYIDELYRLERGLTANNMRKYGDNSNYFDIQCAITIPNLSLKIRNKFINLHKKNYYFLSNHQLRPIYCLMSNSFVFSLLINFIYLINRKFTTRKSVICPFTELTKHKFISFKVLMKLNLTYFVHLSASLPKIEKIKQILYFINKMLNSFLLYALSSAEKLVGALHLIHLFAGHCFDFNLSLFPILF
ncbi:hypothetical protein AGLY_005803 [Aphis glycines]|uniref:Uncharacterized protein n=1 Tax=Aphis glycines TaxID=307491 RepID=A0A6G0TRW8_APHGL|nr:hypothetical protein AGLY_005803 [Aphis glycines]